MLAGADQVADETCWDWRAVRGVLAIALQALGERTPGGMEAVTAGAAL
ncbi:hypothetical protein [Streptomyces violascens]|uniref:Uncharacterized protein n=1 Tax=Streptomyces violascens TaxID=67381 RepID=A0ABQ3QS20_9ACTN|nr:hypothetical protein [Streptomyces violascens]GGU51400.1 hypothetical protein GCM10010289_84700 [Streptomyces violascens]GHI40081.1 hypothetical protein Sviol_44890 [Streptomyces violascens]